MGDAVNVPDDPIIVKAATTDITVQAITDLLVTLRSVLYSSDTLVIAQQNYDIGSYGPKEIMIKIVDSYPCYYRVLPIGPERVGHVLIDPRYAESFDSFDAFLLSSLNIIERVLTNSQVMLKLPDMMPVGDLQVHDPAKLGLPMSSIYLTGFPANGVQSVIGPLCRSMPTANQFIALVNVFDPINAPELSERLLRISMQDMPTLCNVIETFYKYTLDGRLPDKNPVQLNQNILLGVIPAPWNLNRMYEFMPRRARFSSELALEVLGPGISLTPVAASYINTLAGTSMMRAGIVSGFNQIGMSAEMKPAISAFMTSLIIPGWICFDVDLSDIDSTSSNMRLAAALAAKLLLNYHPEGRFNSISDAGIVAVETEILRACLESRQFEAVGERGRWPLDNVFPLNLGRNRAVHHFDDLKTADTSRGWRESGEARIAPTPEDVPYPSCQLRQLCVTEIDRKSECETDIAILQKSQWGVMRGAVELSRVMANAPQRAAMGGFDAVLQAVCNRLFDFFVAVNDYNRKNWYSGLRLSERETGRMYADEQESPCHVRISGKTLLFLLKSLNKDSVLERPMTFPQQISAECGMMVDCVETRFRHQFLRGMLEKFNIPEELYRRSELSKMAMPKEGPLAKYLLVLNQLGLLGDVSRLTEFVITSRLYAYYMATSGLFLDNMLHFGILPTMQIKTTVVRGRLQTMKDLARVGNPYTNFGSATEEREARVITAPNLRDLITDFSVMETIRETSIERPLLISLPFSYDLKVGGPIPAPSDVLIVRYDQINMERDIRRTLRFNKQEIQFIPMDPVKLQRPDLYVSGMSPVNTSNIPYRYLGQLHKAFPEWLGGMATDARVVSASLRGQILFASIFERE